VSSFYTTQNQEIIYAGSLNGGLWKGTKCLDEACKENYWLWKNITDNYPMPGVGINAIEVRPNTNLQTIYIATQFNGNGREYNYSNGILKTTNGGKSWQKIGPDVKITDYKSVDYFKMNKENLNVMIAKIGKEIFITHDDWKSFSLLNVPIKNTDGRVQLGDVEWKPGDFNTIYVTTRCESGIQSEFYITKDGGKNWSDEKHGIKASNIQLCVVNKTGLEDFIYMAYGDPRISIQVYDGKKWSANKNKNLITHTAGSVYWNFEFEVNELDTSVMYCSTTQLSKSINGGSTWSTVTEYLGPATHADIRDMKIMKSTEKGKEDVVVLANDGGISISKPGVLGAQGWINASAHGLCISQLWGIGTSELNQDLLMTGGQDNGMYTFKNGIWSNKIGSIGDGYDVCISELDTNFAIGQGNSPTLCYSKNEGDSWSGTSSPASMCSNFCRPMFLDKKYHNLFIGHHQLFVKNNANGKLDAKWEQCSFIQDVKGEDGTLLNNTIKAFAVSEKSGKSVMLAYAGPLWGKDLLKGKLFFCSDITRTNPIWLDVTKFCPLLNWREVVCITSDPSNDNKYFFTISDVFLPTFSDIFQIEIIENTDSMLIKNISFDLTSYPKNKIAIENNSAKTIYLATDSGIFFTNNRMLALGHWQLYSGGENKLPFCIISDMEINYLTNRLYVSTYGRGVWYSPLCEIGMDKKIKIKKNSSFDKPTKIDGELIIYSGKSLTIKSFLYVTSKAKIILKKNAKLILSETAGKKLILKSDGSIYEEYNIVKEKNARIEILEK
jgi:hypothetical protein